MKYVIWGCGGSGRILARLLGKENIIAFIDRNTDLQHTTFMEIPIVSLEEYLTRRGRELVIIAVTGHEQSIGMQLEQLGIPWITATEVPEHIPVLSQIVLAMDRITHSDDPNGTYVLYGWNVYGVYIYEWLKAHNRKCVVVFQNGISETIQELGSSHFPVAGFEELKKQVIERIFFVEPADTRNRWMELCHKSINVYEIYKEFDLFYNHDLKRFHNMHKGKRCFIIATGPSLRIQDLNTLKEHNEICLSFNGIFYAFQSTEWRPDYYFLTDIYGTVVWEDEFLEMDVKEKFIGDCAWLFSREIPANVHRYHLYYDSENRPKDEYPLFSDDFSKCTYISGSVVYDGALQMAAYMGFSEIYLIGADCTVSADSDKNHFAEAYDEVNTSYNLNLIEILKGYKVAREFCEQHGIKLYNATRGGALEVLERANFDELFDN